MINRRHSSHQCFETRHSSASGLAPVDLLSLKLALTLGKRSANQSGLTLIECLVAIIIITVVVAVITPPVFLAVGTRVNNRRTEQALQIAQAEIERVRVLMISNQEYAAIENELPSISVGIAPDNLQAVAAPTTYCAEPPPAACSGPTALFPAGLELVSDQSLVTPEFYIQTFRDRGEVVERAPVNGVKVEETIAFNMGVRVYSREAVNNDTPNANLQTEPASINFTSGTKARGFKPLVVMYTELTRGTEPDALLRMNEYIEREYKTD